MITAPGRLLPLISLLAAALLIPAAPAAGATPTTRWVDDDGRAGPTRCDGKAKARRDIQGAVNDARPGDRVLVCPGEYPGQVTITKRSLTLRSVRPGAAIVVTGPSHPSSHSLVLVDGAADVRIEGLRVLAATKDPCVVAGGLITVVKSPRAVVQGNRIGIRGKDGFGPCGYQTAVRLVKSNDSLIAGNVATDFRDSGFDASDSKRMRILGNTARFLHATTEPLAYLGQAGIVVQGTPSALVKGNEVRSLPSAQVTTPGVGEGITSYGTSARILGNRVLYAQTGIGLLNQSGSVVRRNRVTGSTIQGIILGTVQDTLVRENTVTGGWDRGVALWNDSTNNQLADNDATGNGGIDCQDDSTGTGTAGTANAWTGNLGEDADPPGICQPPPAP
jgi:parallel beta-helix repeat protein